MALTWQGLDRTRTQNIDNAIAVTYALAAQPNASIWGAVPDTGVDMTANLQEAFNNAPIGSTLVLSPGTYTIAQAGLKCERNISIYAVGAVFNVTATLGTSDVAFQYGNHYLSNTTDKIRRQRVIGLRIVRTPASSATTAALGVGVWWKALYECTIDNVTTEGFDRGHQISGWYTTTLDTGSDSGETGCAYNTFINLQAIGCRYGIYMMPGNSQISGINQRSGWCNENVFIGGRIGNSFTGQTNSKSSCVGVYLQWQTAGGLPEAHDCNNNRFYGMSIENYWGRKLYDEGRYNSFIDCRWEHPWGTTAGGFANPGGYFFKGVYRGNLQGTKTLAATAGPLTTELKRTDYFNVAVDTSGAGNHTVQLPANLTATGQISFYIYDSTNNAATKNITVDGNGWTIDGAATKLINTNGGSLRLLMAGAGQWVSTYPQVAADQVDIEVKATNSSGGANGRIVGGYDLVNCVISLSNNSYNFVQTQLDTVSDRTSNIVARSLELGGALAGSELASQSVIRGNGTSIPGLRIYNTSSGASKGPILELRDNNNYFAKIGFREQGDTNSSPVYWLGTMYFGISTSLLDQNSLSVSNVSPYAIAAKGALGWADSAGLNTGYHVAFKAPALAATTIYTLPAADGAAGTVLSTNGSGTLSWSQTVPAGVVQQYAGTSAPSGWLLCDGSAVSRTTYAALFAITSTTYGVGDGSTTFNLPDLRDKFARGKSGTVALGATGGTTTYSHSGATVGNHTTTTVEGNATVSPVVVLQTAAHTVGQASNHTGVEPPYLSLNYIIKT